MSAATVIEWDAALEQCGGDVNFLKEILGDFMTESTSALQVIIDGMRTRHFLTVMKAGHQIKGSASYLSCGDIMRSAAKIQNLGNEGSAALEAEQRNHGMSEHRSPSEVWADVEQEYQTLGATIQYLERAIAVKFGGS